MTKIEYFFEQPIKKGERKKIIGKHFTFTLNPICFLNTARKWRKDGAKFKREEKGVWVCDMYDNAYDFHLSFLPFFENGMYMLEISKLSGYCGRMKND